LTRWRRRIAIIAFTPLAAYAVLLVDWREARPPVPPVMRRQAEGAGPLEVGAARVPFTPRLPVVMAGYGPRKATADRVRDAVHARALVMRQGEAAVGLVLLDVVLVPDELVAALETRVGDLRLDGLLVAATHTHSSAGGFDRRWLAQVIGMGRYRADVEQSLLDAGAQAVRSAHARLRPARARAARDTLDGWAYNRSSPGARVDDALTVILCEGEDGKPEALLAVAAAHPTVLARSGTALSGEYPGAAMRRLEEGGGVAFLMQGAGGDAALRGKGEDVMESAGAFLAQRVSEATRRATPAPDRLAYAEVAVELPAPEVRGLRSFWLARPASNLAVGILSGSARVAALEVGDTTLLAVPGEITAEVGRRLAAQAGSRGGRAARVVSLSQGYLGYVDTPEAVLARRGEARRTWFGPDLADRLGRGLRAAADGLSRGPRSSPPP
jgi:neutral ceramidase